MHRERTKLYAMVSPMACLACFSGISVSEFINNFPSFIGDLMVIKCEDDNCLETKFARGFTVVDANNLVSQSSAKVPYMFSDLFSLTLHLSKQ